MRRMWLAVVGVVGLLGAESGMGSVWAQPSPEAVAVLEEAREAISALESVEYDAEYEVEGEGMLAQAASKTVAKVSAAKTEQGWIRRVDGVAEPIAFLGEDERPIVAVTDGVDSSWLMSESKTVVQAYGRAASRRLPAEVDSLAPEDIFSAEPFARTLSSSLLELGAREEFDGFPCDVITSRAGDRGIARDWFIDVDSRLPRGWRQVIDGGEKLPGSATTTVSFRNMRTGVAVDPSVFELETPPGYSVLVRGRRPEVEQAERPKTPALTTSRVVGTEVGNIAPAFEVSDQAGNAVSLESLAGEPAILYFFSSWNPRCGRLNDDLAAMIAEMGDASPKLVGFAIRERDPNAPKAIAEQLGMTLSIGARDVAGMYEVRSVPAVFVLDTEGRIVHAEGGHTPDETIKRIREALESIAE